MWGMPLDGGSEGRGGPSEEAAFRLSPEWHRGGRHMPVCTGTPQGEKPRGAGHQRNSLEPSNDFGRF